MARSRSNSTRGSRSAGRSSGRGRSSGGRSSSRGGSRGGRQQGGADYMKVGDLSLTKKAKENEESIKDALIELIEEGASLEEVLQESGLQLWLRFYIPDEGKALKFKTEDRIIVSFKQPPEGAPDFLLASASTDVSS